MDRICDLCQLSSPSGCTKLSNENCLNDALRLIKAMATNGDIIKALFPHISVKDNCQNYYSVDIENLSKDKSFNTIGFRKDWWNASYKAGDTDGKG